MNRFSNIARQDGFSGSPATIVNGNMGCDFWDVSCLAKSAEASIREVAQNNLSPELYAKAAAYAENKLAADIKNAGMKELQKMYVSNTSPKQRAQIEAKMKNIAVESAGASIGNKVGVFTTDLMKGVYNTELMMIGGGIAAVIAIIVIKKSLK